MKKTTTYGIAAFATCLATGANADSSFVLAGGDFGGTTPVSTSLYDPQGASAHVTLGADNGGAVSTGGSATKPSSSRSSAAASSGGGTSSGGGFDSAKDGGKVIVPTPAAPAPFIFNVEVGYQSDYVYHGLSQVTNAITNNPNTDYDVIYAGVGVQYKGFNLGVKYAFSLDDNLTPRFGGSPQTYEELTIDIGYTIGLIPGPEGEGNWLDLSVGYQYQDYSSNNFWGVGNQDRWHVRLKSNGYKWIRPSATYYDFDANNAILTGEQIILQIDGGDQVFDNGSVQVGLGYYVQVGLDNNYNIGSSSFREDWWQYGVSVPVTFSGVTVTPSFHYTDRVSGGSGPDFWWGLATRYTF